MHNFFRMHSPIDSKLTIVRARKIMWDLVTNGKMFGGLEQQEDAKLREFAPAIFYALWFVILRRRPQCSAYIFGNQRRLPDFSMSVATTPIPGSETAMIALSLMVDSSLISHAACFLHSTSGSCFCGVSAVTVFSLSFSIFSLFLTIYYLLILFIWQ